ncbi:MAG: MCP four helix bundle domain-containing protein, partial [Aeromonas sp.]
MNSSTMTIGKKLTAGFAVLGLLVAFIGGFAIFQFGNMNGAALRFADSILPAVNRTSEIGDTLSELRRYELALFLWDSEPQKRAEYRTTVAQLVEHLKQQVIDHDKSIWALNVEERRTFDIVKADWASYLMLHQQVKQLQESDQMAEALNIFRGQGSPLYNKLNQSVDELIRINHGYASESRQDVVNAYQAAKLSVTIALVIGL